MGKNLKPGDLKRGKLMWACFLTLIASGFGFATRAAAGSVWESEFGIDGKQFGQIMGAGFLGFGMMIFFGGILVEKLGYKLLLAIAFALHLISALMLFGTNMVFDAVRESDAADAAAEATNAAFWVLWASAFLFSICQGLYEAVINPVIAQVYPENKTHYLNILHAGWPGGMIIGGLFAAGFIGESAWFMQIPWSVALASFAVFVVIYGFLAFPEKFPAAVGQKNTDSFLRTFSCFASIPFLVLLVLHGCIGYMELGVDSWMTKLMENLLPNSIIILVYTSFLMFILRFFAGPIVHKINPIGLLLASSVIAVIGLIWLGMDIKSVAVIFLAATFYSFGKAFLWPTMLGIAGERYPQSGSVAMGALGAAGMLTVGLIAGSRIGSQQGYAMSDHLKENAPQTFERYAVPEDEESTSWGLTYRMIVAEKLNAANRMKIEEGKFTNADEVFDEKSIINSDDQEILAENAVADAPAVQEAYLIGSRKALTWTAYIPGIMSIGFLGLLIYYQMIGGYKVVELDEDGNPHETDHHPDAKETMDDGAEGPTSGQA